MLEDIKFGEGDQFLSFYSQAQCVAELSLKGGVVVFEGSTDEAATKLFNILKYLMDEYIESKLKESK